MYYVIIPTGSDLYHHGILGQKWGKRNGPPYPLNASAHSSAENKVGWKKSLKSSSGKQTETRAKSKKGEASGSVAAYLAVYLGITALSFSPVLIAAAADSVSRGKAKLKEHREDKLRTKLKKDEKTGLPLKKKEMSPKEDIKHINPGFKNGEKDTTMNCPFCVTAYELRRRGFDVRAGKTEKGRFDEDIEKFYKEKKKFKYAELPGKDKEHAPTAKDISKTMDDTLLHNSGDGTRGTVKVIWKYGGAHVFNYDIKDGKVHYYDGQNGKEYNIQRDVAPSVRTISQKTTKRGTGCWAYLRTDNLTPDYKFLKKEGVIV
jgi:hypothetical protein